MVINASRRVLRCIVISAREGHRASRASGYHAATEASSKSAIGSSSISNETISSNHASCHESGPRFLKSDRAVVMSGCDRASGELSVLSAVHIDKMIAICTNLEYADALKGTRSMHIYLCCMTSSTIESILSMYIYYMSCDETTPGVAMMTNMTRLMMYNR